MADEEELRKERERQEDLKVLRDLRPVDDDFMRRIFKDNRPLVQKVLRIIIQKPELKVIRSETQADMKRLAGARSICLDVLGEDDDGKQYDIEVQRDHAGAGTHRARYHSSVMDVENLDSGKDFNQLPDTYVIFITEKDIFHMGLPVYPIERMNVQLNVPFNDGGHILYVNGAYRGDDDIGRLMHDFLCSNPDDMYDSDMAEAARHCKENIREVDNMCEAIENLVNRRAEERALRMVEERGDKIMEEIAEERAEKMAEERAKEMASEMANKKSKEIALALITLGAVSFENIAKVTALSLEEVNELAGSRTAS